MKRSKSKIWQKKRQRKFKNTKRLKTTSPVNNKQKPARFIPGKKDEPIKKQSLINNYINLGLRPRKNEKKKKLKAPSGNIFSTWQRQHDSDVQLILFPLILLVVLIILTIFNNQLFLTIAKQEPVVTNLTTPLNPYPYVSAVNAPVISAKAAIILDRDSQVILYSKNPLLRFSMASTTKIMTALIGVGYYKPDDILTVKTGNVEGSELNLFPGEQFRFIDLMYAMLLPSENAAAQAIAGGASMFVNKMNEKAQSLHLINTHYSDPIGLDDDGDYSTPVDMARLASYASTNQTIEQITSTKSNIINAINFFKQYPLTNTNELLGIDGVTGIKTGTTEGAGEVLVTSVVKNGHEYIIVVMDSTDRFYDTEQLINYIDNDVRYVQPPPPVL
jgi:D-alanyl-D-alanine carboxypeptidase